MIKIYLPTVRNGKKEKFILCTYNIGYDGNTWGLTPQARVERIVNQINGQGAEIVALQEVIHKGSQAEVGEFINQFDGWSSFTQPHNSTNHYSNMILSKYPIRDGSQRTQTIISKNGRNDRVNLSVILETPVGPIRVWSIHTRFEEPDDGTKQLLKGVKLVADSEPGIPYIVMGDFNTGKKNVMDIAKEVGLNLNITPVGRIDHILSSDLSLVDSIVLPRPNVPGEHDPIFSSANT